MPKLFHIAFYIMLLENRILKNTEIKKNQFFPLNSEQIVDKSVTSKTYLTLLEKLKVNSK